MDSILNTIKEMLGVDKDDSAFDSDIASNINNALMSLRQIGVRLKSGLVVTGATETWKDLTDNSELIEYLKMYIHLKTKSIFDPTSNSVVSQAYKETLSELEWRLNSESDYGEEIENE